MIQKPSLFLKKRPCFEAYAIFLILLCSEGALALEIKAIPDLLKQNSRHLKEAQYQVNADEAANESARKQYFPKVQLESSYSRLDKDIELDIGPKRIDRDILGGNLNVAIEVDPPPLLIQDKDITKMALELKQPLYTGGLIEAGIENTMGNLNVSKATLLKVADERLAETLIKYFQTKMAIDMIKILSEISDNLKTMAKISNALVANGAAPQFSLLQIKAKQAEMASELLQAQSSEQLLRSVLAYYTGQNDLAGHDLKDPLIKIAIDKPLDQFLNSALETRPELKIIKGHEQKIKALEMQVDSKILPKVFGFGKYELLDQDLLLTDPKWVVGFGIQVPLTQGISYSSDRSEAINLKHKLNEASLRAHEEIPLEVRNYYNSVVNLGNSLDAEREAVTLAVEAYKISLTRFHSGSGSSLEILQTSSSLQKTKVTELLTLEQYNRAIIKLYLGSGKISDYIAAFNKHLTLKK